ncbi:glycosyltransferase [Telluribacter humicola]|uniref:glycosyltransferase n=1 Tax=Telluribacter humicola TaxID=1720261 RepID=UPI001E613B57|nr:glycosyltransferase [Telluribacter humicola]
MDPAYGGPSQGIRVSIPELEKLGVHNEVVCLDEPNNESLQNDTFPIHALGKAKGPWAYNRNISPWLFDNLDRFDVVILHGLWLHYGYSLYKVINQIKKFHPKKSTPRFYIMPHGMLDPWFQNAKGRRLKAIRNSLYWKLFENKIINHADGVLFTCKQELLLARETFPNYYPKEELNVGYGIATPPEHSAEMDMAFYERCPEVKGQPYILFLSRINVKKGVDLLVNAYLYLKANGLVLPKIVIAGPGLDSPYGKSIKQIASVDKDIIFPGMLTGNAKWGAFYCCEAFALPSHQENFGIAVVEAMACSKPVLVSNQVNIWREIEVNKGGIIADDTLDGTCQILKSFITCTNDERNTMGKSAFCTFKKHFHIRTTAYQLYQSLFQSFDSNDQTNSSACNDPRSLE